MRADLAVETTEPFGSTAVVDEQLSVGHENPLPNVHFIKRQLPDCTAVRG